MPKEEFEERFARSIADDLCGKIVRAKGFIIVGNNERIQFDYVTGKLLVRDFDQETDGRLVFIGNALNRERLLTIWQQESCPHEKL